MENEEKEHPVTWEQVVAGLFFIAFIIIGFLCVCGVMYLIETGPTIKDNCGKDNYVWVVFPTATDTQLTLQARQDKEDADQNNCLRNEINFFNE